MSDVAIKVDGLGKQYRIGGSQPRYHTFQEALLRTASAPMRWMRGEYKDENTIWALEDVSFEIKHGEAVGIIGRNGAGKSTLLKILSRITRPTRGRVDLYGRVGSLLEVGTGFHPELTGRENIYLNGAILGMTRREIERKFDEIVDFAEVEKFLDTPVKHYSSGMYVRLAFAVAAHLEPEILVVDEVLAVGDAAFQRKSLGKMSEVANQGRTVLFVSHNMAAISHLCSTCIWIDSGGFREEGETATVIDHYLVSGSQPMENQTSKAFNLKNRVNIYGEGKIYINHLSLKNSDGNVLNTFQMGNPMLIEIDIDNVKHHRNLNLGVIFRSFNEHYLTNINTKMKGREFPRLSDNEFYKATLTIPRLPFLPNSYRISISLVDSSSNRIDYVERAADFEVVASDVYHTGFMMQSKDGVFYLDADWDVKENLHLK